MGDFDKNMPRFELIDTWGGKRQNEQVAEKVKEKSITYKVKEIIVKTLEDEMKFELLEELMEKYSLVEIENILNRIK